MGYLVILICVLACGIVTPGRGFELEGSAGAYAEFPKWNPCQNGSLVLEFSTVGADGLILYTDDGGMFDFLEVKLVSGEGWVRYSYGHGITLLTAGRNLNDGQWHKIEFHRNDAETKFVVDDIDQSKVSSGYELNFGDYESNGHLYIGGVPLQYRDNLRSMALPSALFEPRLRGRIRGLRYGDCGSALRAVDMLTGVGVRHTQDDHCALSDPCQHQGFCINTDHGATCDCTRVDFTGDFCQKGM